MKLTKKQKERNKQYLRKIKIISELNEIIFGKVKTTKCTKCKKTIEVKKLLDCRNEWLTHMHKNKKMGISDSQFPFGIVQSMFQSTNPLVLCKQCQYDVYRFMGKIPDLHSHEVFPQRYSSYSSADAMIVSLESKKHPKYQIHYKNKKYKDSPKKYDKLLLESVKAYIKKYPHVKYSEKQLVRIIKNYKLQDSVSIF